MSAPVRYARVGALLLLLLMAWRIRAASAAMSDTFDEIIHILHGVLYWRQTPLYPVVENPPLINALIGLPVALLHHPALPVEMPIWQTGNWLRISQSFAWEINPNGLMLIWTGRLVVWFLALLTGAVLFRWGREMFGSPTAALFALFLFSMDPNVLAHSGLATTDIGTTFLVCLAAWLLWRCYRAPGRRRYAAAGIAVGCAMGAKFSAVVLWPAIALVAAYQVVAGVTPGNLWRRSARAAAEIGGLLAIATVVFLTVYRFDLAALAADFSNQSRHFAAGHSSYLLGQTGTTGWWYYFPVVFLAKTPAPVLLLLLGALLVGARESRQRQRTGRRIDLILWPLLLAGGIGAASLLSRVNLGYRYLLPALPLLWLFVARLVLPSAGRWGRSRLPVAPIAAWALALIAAVAVARYHPHYLAWFNRIAGGPEEGRRIAVDSNIDWGQDVGRLARYLDDRQIPFVNASWLGSAPPEAYHIRGRLLPVWPAAQRDRLYDPFYPPRPAPGFYALSVTQLTGVYLENKDEFAWFRARLPDAKAGYSIFLYDVPADGPPVQVALGGVAVADIATADYAQTFQSNDVRLRWFDPQQALLWPHTAPGEAAWVVVGDGHLPLPAGLADLYPAQPTADCRVGRADRRYCFIRPEWEPVGAGWQTGLGWELPSAEAPGHALMPLSAPAVFGDTFALTGWQIVAEQTDGERLLLLTAWQVQAAPAGAPRLFLHLLDDAGAIIAQHDGLGVLPQGLRPGDRFVQRHGLSGAADLHAGRLSIGVYDEATGARYPVPVAPDRVADRLFLRPTVTDSSDPAIPMARTLPGDVGDGSNWRLLPARPSSLCWGEGCVLESVAVLRPTLCAEDAR